MLTRTQRQTTSGPTNERASGERQWTRQSQASAYTRANLLVRTKSHSFFVRGSMLAVGADLGSMGGLGRTSEDDRRGRQWVRGSRCSPTPPFLLLSAPSPVSPWLRACVLAFASPRIRRQSEDEAALRERRGWRETPQKPPRDRTACVALLAQSGSLEAHTHLARAEDTRHRRRCTAASRD